MVIFKKQAISGALGLVFGMGAMLGAEAALAQDHVAGFEGQCPQEELITRSASDTLRPSDDDIAEIFSTSGLQVIYPNNALFQTSRAVDQIDGAPLSFATRVNVLQRAPSLGTVLVQATSDAKEICGWIDQSVLLSANGALPVVEIPGYEDAAGVDFSRASTLKAKVVAREDGNAETITKVSLFQGPSGSKEDFLRPLEFFTIADVFRVETSSGRRCVELSDDECFVLLGGTELVDNGEGDFLDIATIIGWVRGTDVSLWPSAISLDFAEAEQGVPFYLTTCDADGDRVCAGRPAREAGVGSYRAPKDRVLPKFPVVNVKAPEDTQADPFVYEIVTALRLCDEERQKCRSSEYFLTETGEKGQIQSELGNVDIVYVIDASESMEAYFEPAVDAAIEFSQSLKGTRIKARFGAVVYEDYMGNIGNKDTVSLNKIVPLGQRGNATNLNALTARAAVQSSVSDVLRDPFEAPLAAITKIFDDGFMDWSEDSRLKVVVWIADIGNRPLGANPTKNPSIPVVDERTKVDDIVFAVQSLNAEAGSSVVFSGIHVPGASSSEGLTSFQANYEALSEKLSIEPIPIQIVNKSGDGSGAKDRIVVAFDVLKDAVNRMIGETENIENLPEDQANLPAFRIARQVLAERGILDQNMTAINAGELLEIERYFVVQDPVKPRFEYWLALRLDDLLELQRKISLLCDTMETTDFATDLFDSYSAVMETVVRENLPDEMSVADWTSKRLSVPKDKFSDLLRRADDRTYLGELLRDGKERARVRGNVCIRAMLFDFVRKGVAISPDDLTIGRSRRVTLRKGFEEKPFAWDWRPLGGVQYYFVPLSFLP